MPGDAPDLRLMPSAKLGLDAAEWPIPGLTLHRRHVRGARDA